jgi:hypothetical protein
VSTLASIFYENDPYIHVAHETQDDAIYVEITDEDGGPSAGCHYTYEQAIEMATRILSYANWPDLINRRDMRGR